MEVFVTLLNGAASAAVNGFFAVLGFLVIILFLLAVAMYLLQSIGFYKMGKRAGVSNSWLAFIPPFNGYVMGKILGPERVKFLGQKITSPELLIPVTPFIMAFSNSLTASGSALLYLLYFVINLVGVIFLLVCNYQFLKMYKGESAKILFILSLVFPIIWPFLIFSMRNADPVDSVYNYDDYNDYYYTE